MFRGMFKSILGLYSVDTSSTISFSCCENQKYLSTLPNIPWTTKSPVVKNFILCNTLFFLRLKILKNSQELGLFWSKYNAPLLISCSLKSIMTYVWCFIGRSWCLGTFCAILWFLMSLTLLKHHFKNKRNGWASTESRNTWWNVDSF